jgi:hypothetical protein
VKSELEVASEADNTDDGEKPPARPRHDARAGRLRYCYIATATSRYCYCNYYLTARPLPVGLSRRVPLLPHTAQVWHAVPCSERAAPMPDTSLRRPTVAEDARLNVKAAHEFGDLERPITAPVHSLLTSPARSHPNAAHAKELPLHLILLILSYVRTHRPTRPCHGLLPKPAR